MIDDKKDQTPEIMLPDDTARESGPKLDEFAQKLISTVNEAIRKADKSGVPKITLEQLQRFAATKH